MQEISAILTPFDTAHHFINVVCAVALYLKEVSQKLNLKNYYAVAMAVCSFCSMFTDNKHHRKSWMIHHNIGIEVHIEKMLNIGKYRFRIGSIDKAVIGPPFVPADKGINAVAPL